MAESLHFIAIVVEGEAGETITGFKQYAAQHFGASRALTSPPHVTLIPPFSWQAERYDELTACLEAVVAKYPPPRIQLKNFNCFEPRVIYVDVLPDAKLTRFQQALEAELYRRLGIRTDRQYGFHPHVTIAFKDLKTEVFPKAWAWFSAIGFAHTFAPASIALLEHREQGWKLNKLFYFYPKLLP